MKRSEYKHVAIVFTYFILTCWQVVYGICLFMDSANVPCMWLDISMVYHTCLSLSGIIHRLPLVRVYTESSSDNTQNRVISSHLESFNQIWGLALLWCSNRSSKYVSPISPPSLMFALDWSRQCTGGHTSEQICHRYCSGFCSNSSINWRLRETRNHCRTRLWFDVSQSALYSKISSSI